jgi:hypothetical protein
VASEKRGIQRIDRGKTHFYKLDGQKVEGVTTLIKGGLPSPALIRWAAKAVAEHVAETPPEELEVLRKLGPQGFADALKSTPWKKLNDAAVRGTEVHNLAEKLVAGHEIDVPDHVAGHVEACIQFFDDWQVDPVTMERPVASRKWRYAGTFDLVADITPPRQDRTRALLDYKTSKSGIFSETSLQLAAYRWAEIYAAEDGSERSIAELGIQEAYAVWLRADGYDVIPVRTDEEVFKSFCHVAYVARRIDTMKTWIGEAIQPERALSL